MLVFILLCVIAFMWHVQKANENIAAAAPVAARTGTWWKVTFKAKKTPPIEVEGPDEGIVARNLMKTMDYKLIAAIERIP